MDRAPYVLGRICRLAASLLPLSCSGDGITSEVLESIRGYCIPETAAKMRSSLVSTLLLSASCWAAPVQQHPLVHAKSPYRKDFHDPYDHKIDAIGHDLQPEPMVSTMSFRAFRVFSDVMTD